MARKKVVDLDAENAVGFGKEEGQIPPGHTLEGHYIGGRKVKTKFGMATLHVLQTESGNLGVWGSAQLDAKLGTVPPGSMVFITYVKKIKVTNGTMKVFEVEYDDEDRVEASAVQVNFQDSSEGEEDAEEESSEAEDVEEEAEEESKPEPAKAASKPAASKSGKPAGSTVSDAQKARVAALLGKKKSG